jgi:hypothetical protein
MGLILNLSKDRIVAEDEWVLQHLSTSVNFNFLRFEESISKLMLHVTDTNGPLWLRVVLRIIIAMGQTINLVEVAIATDETSTYFGIDQPYEKA